MNAVLSAAVLMASASMAGAQVKGDYINLLSHPASRGPFVTNVAPPPVTVPNVCATNSFGSGSLVTGSCGAQPVLVNPISGTQLGLTTGSGLTVNGQYTGQNWRLGFHLGSGIGAVGTPTVLLPSSYYCPRGGVFWGYRSYAYNPYFDGYGYTRPAWMPIQGAVTQYDQRMIDALAAAMLNQSQQPQQAAPAQPETPPTPLETARWKMVEGHEAEAVREYRLHMKDHADDATAARELGVAMILSSQSDDGTAMIRAAYRQDPSLARTPIETAPIGLDEKRLRDALTTSVAYAHKVKTASAWLTVAVLMQAQGRPDVAKAMLDRSIKAGLDREISSELTAALGK